MTDFLESEGQGRSKLFGEACLLTVGAFLLTVELFCLQSVQVLSRTDSHRNSQKKG